MIRNLVLDEDGNLPEIPQDRIDLFDRTLRELRAVNGTVATGGKGVTVGDKLVALSQLDMSDVEWMIFVFGLGYKVGYSRGNDPAPAESETSCGGHKLIQE